MSPICGERGHSVPDQLTDSVGRLHPHNRVRQCPAVSGDSGERPGFLRLPLLAPLPLASSHPSPGSVRPGQLSVHHSNRNLFCLQYLRGP